MDEPFGALDARTREALQHELDRIRRESGCSIVFVTHDIWKALPLADRVVAMTVGPKAGIKTFEPVDLPHPPDQGGEACLALRRRLRDDPGEEVRHALERHGLKKEGALT